MFELVDPGVVVALESLEHEAKSWLHWLKSDPSDTANRPYNQRPERLHFPESVNLQVVSGEG